MLKGETYGGQLFENSAFRLAFDTMLGGKSGVIEDFGNEMEVSASGTTVTISDGVAVIKGGIVRETSSQTLTPTLAENLYYSVVLEIDLSLTNTRDVFNQGSFKLISNSGSYPTLTQQDITRIADGKYQMELARFTTTNSAIQNLTDRRTMLSYTALAIQLQEAIDRIIAENLSAEDVTYGDSNVKAKLDSLSDSQNIVYSGSTTVKSAIDNLNTQLNGVATALSNI